MTTDAKSRRRTSNFLKNKYERYLDNAPGSNQIPNFGNKSRTLRTCISSILRKEEGSHRLEREIPRIARIIFGIKEDIRRLRLPELDLDEEILIINNALVSLIKRNLRTMHEGECKFYGEAILGSYLNAFITFTVLSEELTFGDRPYFLRNPTTGRLLQLDIQLEEFNIVFEFQGEFHYTDIEVMKRDAIKRTACSRANRVLIPVNISQLSSGALLVIISNSVMDYIRARELVESSGEAGGDGVINKSLLLSFKKSTHRMFLAKTIFGEALSWLDRVAETYIAGQEPMNPISTSTPAPRCILPKRDLSLEEIYRSLKHFKGL